VSRVRSVEIILALGNVQATEAEKNKWLVQKNEEYLSYLVTMDEKELLPDVPRVLAFLKEHQQFIALGSASKNARPILEKTNILHYFDAIVDGNDVSNAKPDPEVFIRAAQLVGVSNTNSIVFEDSVAGIQAANAAQMISIGVGDPLVLHEAQYHFKDFTSLEDAFLEKLIN
jgi:beta-phosphoglucomutase